MKKLLLIIIILWSSLFVTDYILSINNHKPLVIFKTNNYETRIEYISLGYKVIEYNVDNIKIFKMHFLTYKSDYKIIEPDECSKGDTVFYSDDNYEYYFFCSKTDYLQLDKDVKIKLDEAIKNNYLTLNELKEKGVDFGKKSKNSYIMEIKGTSNCNYYDGDINSLTSISDNLSYYCLESANIYVNSNYYSLSEALKKYNMDQIIYDMNKDITYESGSVMYSRDNYKILVCKNNKIIIGTDKLENFDFLCE